MPSFGEIENLYDEIVAFFVKVGGYYEGRIDQRLCWEIIESLMNGQYYLDRDGSGQIVTYCHYWRIAPEEVVKIFHSATPDDIVSGSVVMVGDMGNLAGMKGMYRMIRELRRRNPDAQGAAFWNKGERFAYFKSQRGSHG